MSFLKAEVTEKVNALETTKDVNLPQNYEASETMVHVTPVPLPTTTQTFDHNLHTAQKEICEKLSNEEPALFDAQSTIVRLVSNEKQYKQRQQFTSRASVESLCKVMDENKIVLKCNFIRPGFCASNTCLMCKSDDLKQAMTSEADEFSLKKVKLSLSSDSELSPQNGTMYLSLLQKKNGNHVVYSLDYHIQDRHDQKLFSK